MIKQSPLAILMSLLTFSTFGQTNPAPAVTNWGDSVSGAQLGIALSNKTVSAGTNIAMTCWVKNSSTNLIGFQRRTIPEFYAVLTNSSGSFYELTKDHEKAFFVSRMMDGARPGETRAFDITLAFGADIKPGIYKLFVRRIIHADNKWQDLLSNVLEIQVTHAVDAVDQKKRVN